MIRSIACCGIVGLALCWLGCGGSGPEMYDISGKVTFDGQPVEKGEIVFRAADGTTGSGAGKITDGRYEVRCMPGAKQVEITALRQMAGQAAESGEPAIATESYIPQKYNTRSELTAQVDRDGPRQFDFDLTP